MDSRDWIILGVVGLGGWWLYKRLQNHAQPVVDGNPAGAASMHAGAAAVTKSGLPSVKGIVAPPRDLAAPRLGGGSPSSTPFRTTAGKLLGLNLAPQPTQLVPTVQSGTTTGSLPVHGSLPPPQRLNPTINPSIRGVS